MNTSLPWQPRNLLLAPHRLGFFLAMVLLWCVGLWWALVQIDRVTGALGLAYVLSPSLVHGAAMTFGFIPLFFSGFLFTAGPKWLGVAPPDAPQLLAPLLLQAGGRLLWLAGVWGLVTTVLVPLTVTEVPPITKVALATLVMEVLGGVAAWAGVQLTKAATAKLAPATTPRAILVRDLVGVEAFSS